MNMMKRIIFICLIASGLDAVVSAINLFNPYDILMLQPLIALPEFQVSVGYERFINGCGMQADDDELCQSWRKCCNILQIYQDSQDAIAAYKGTDFNTPIGQQTLVFPVDDDNGTHGLLTPCGDLTIDNFMLSARYAWCNGVSFGLYLPVIKAHLKNVRWKSNNLAAPYESQIDNNTIKVLEETGKLCLGNWSRHGLGDLAALFMWNRYYPQNKRWLKNVHGGLRGGLLFPTGLKSDEDLLLAFPFGNDGSLGVLGGATLELWWGGFLRFGVDGEFTQIFGTCRTARIKTDPAQTDLLFLVKAPVNREVGFMQHYTLYLQATHFWRGLSFRAAYQYTKHNDDKLFLATDHYDAELANTAEYLQEWTMHNLVLSATYDSWLGKPRPQYWPTVMAFYKHGFNGKRAVLGNTIGLQLTINF